MGNEKNVGKESSSVQPPEGARGNNDVLQDGPKAQRTKEIERNKMLTFGIILRGEHATKGSVSHPRLKRNEAQTTPLHV